MPKNDPENDRNNDSDNDQQAEEGSEFEERVEPRSTPHRLIMPLGMRVLVSVVKDEDRTDAGLYLPQGAKEAQDEALYGEVIEVARDKPTTDDIAKNVSGVPEGAKVLFKKEAGVRVPWDERLRLLDVADVLATVEELSDHDAH